jgi:hypothetical protein
MGGPRALMSLAKGLTELNIALSIPQELAAVAEREGMCARD